MMTDAKGRHPRTLCGRRRKVMPDLASALRSLIDPFLARLSICGMSLRDTVTLEDIRFWLTDEAQ